MPTKRAVALLLAIVTVLTVPVLVLTLRSRWGTGGPGRPGAVVTAPYASAPALASPTAAPSSPSSVGLGRWPGSDPWQLYTGPEGTEGSDGSYEPAISDNGRWVAFSSTSSNLIRGDTNRASDIFVKDRATGNTRRVSVSSSGRQANDDSMSPKMSADGRLIAFISYASNLVASDTNRCTDHRNSEREPCPDVFVHDQLTHGTVRVSVSSSGAQSNDASDYGLALSANGRYVAFASEASNLVPGDRNAVQDIFVHDRHTGNVVLVSISSTGAQANRQSFEPAVSDDGQRIAFGSIATNLGGKGSGNGTVYLHDRRSHTTTNIAPTAEQSGNVAISRNGRAIAFYADGDHVVPGDTNKEEDGFVYDVANGRTTRISVSSSGEQADGGTYGPFDFSSDGRYVAFPSRASNLVDGDDARCQNLMDDAGVTFSCSDIFLRDRVRGTTELLSISTVGAQADQSSWDVSLSADARYVAFGSAATNLGPGPHRGCLEWGNCPDIYVRDRAKRTTRIASTAAPRTRAKGDGDGYSREPSISADGSVVAFVATGTNFVRNDTNAQPDIIVWRRGGGVARVSISTTGTQANRSSGEPAVSGDGRVVAYTSEATNLVPDDTNGDADIFVRDMARHRTERVSVSSSGSQANGPSSQPKLTRDGRYVVFTSVAANLVPADTNGAPDVFLYDRVAKATTRVSVATDGAQGDAGSEHGSPSADGKRIAFVSAASNLVAGDSKDCPNTNLPGSCADIFVRDLADSATVAVSVTDDGKTANGSSSEPSLSADGTHVAFLSSSNNIAEGRNPDEFADALYVRDVPNKKTVRVNVDYGDPVQQLSLSAEGRYLAAGTEVFDLMKGTRVLVTSCGSTEAAVIASAGRFVAFHSSCRLDDRDRNEYLDVYVYDLRTRSTTWASRPIR